MSTLNIKHIITLLTVFLAVSFLSAQDNSHSTEVKTSEVAVTATPVATENKVAEAEHKIEEAVEDASGEVAAVDHKVDEVVEKFDPKPMIMHHIKDAHSWDVLHRFAIPLPCIIYGPNGLSFFMYKEGADIDGYTCEEGAISREDGAKFYDFSITKNVMGMIIGAIILIVMFLSIKNTYDKNKGKAPSGLQSLIEPIIVFVRDDVAKPALHSKYEKYLPYLLTIFFFILINNLLGLIPIFPGGANVTGNIAFTLVLGIISFLVINISGNKYYWKHILAPDVPVFLYPIMIPVELLGIFTKPISLIVRLFANMTAGHIIVLSLVSLIFVFGNAGKSLMGSALGVGVAIPFTLFISVIEVLVAFIQAFIFTNLTAIFIGMAIEEHH